MKLMKFTGTGESERIGALARDGTSVVDLNAAHASLTGAPSENLASMLNLIEAGDEGLVLARAALAFGESNDGRSCKFALDEVALLSPVPRPTQIRNFSVYEKHIKQAFEAVVRMRAGEFGVRVNRVLKLLKVPKQWYEFPLYYKGNRMNVIGHDTDVQWPKYDDLLDYELELGFFIGKRGIDISKANALDHIFGYTILNDFSARRILIKEVMARGGPAKGKDFDTANAIGPWIVTKDEIPDPQNLAMSVRVNGEERGRANSGDMYHKIDEMIAYVSQSETLYPGEFFGTGATGDGCGMEQLRFLSPNDVVELEIEGIGVLRNRIVKG